MKAKNENRTITWPVSVACKALFWPYPIFFLVAAITSAFFFCVLLREIMGFGNIIVLRGPEWILKLGFVLFCGFIVWMGSRMFWSIYFRRHHTLRFDDQRVVFIPGHPDYSQIFSTINGKQHFMNPINSGVGTACQFGFDGLFKPLICPKSWCHISRIDFENMEIELRLSSYSLKIKEHESKESFLRSLSLIENELERKGESKKTDRTQGGAD